MAQVVGKEDRGHTTMADLTLETVTLGERGLETREKIWQKRRQRWGTFNNSVADPEFCVPFHSIANLYLLIRWSRPHLPVLCPPLPI